jgi:hypothetical protein
MICLIISVWTIYTRLAHSCCFYSCTFLLACDFSKPIVSSWLTKVNKGIWTVKQNWQSASLYIHNNLLEHFNWPCIHNFVSWQHLLWRKWSLFCNFLLLQLALPLSSKRKKRAVSSTWIFLLHLVFCFFSHAMNIWTLFRSEAIGCDLFSPVLKHIFHSICHAQLS